MGNGINPTHWWAEGIRRRHGIGPQPGAAGAAQRQVQLINGLFNKAATGVGIHPGMTGNLLSGAPLPRARSCTAASAWIRCWPATSANRRCSRAWSWAASSRSPATTRRTSRWPTARTSPGRTPTSPVPMEVYPSLAFDSLFDNRGSQRNQSILDRVRGAGRLAQPAGQLRRQGQARRISHQRPRRREARAGHARGEREGRRERDRTAAARRRR